MPVNTVSKHEAKTDFFFVPEIADNVFLETGKLTIIGNVNILVSVIDSASRKTRYTELIHQMDLVDIKAILHVTTAEYIHSPH